MSDIIKCVAVGDGAVGKTCLLWSYANDQFPGEYIPTVVDNYSTNLIVDQKHVTLLLWDTAGQEDYDRLRPMAYPRTDFFLVVFALNAPHSLQNVKQKWVKELKQYAPEAPIVLVGTKVDLRDAEAADKLAQGSAASEETGFVTNAEGKQVSQEIGAVAYYEVSALTQKNLKEMFNDAVHLVWRQRKDKIDKKSSRCTVL